MAETTMTDVDDDYDDDDGQYSTVVCHDMLTWKSQRETAKKRARQSKTGNMETPWIISPIIIIYLHQFLLRMGLGRSD